MRTWFVRLYPVVKVDLVGITTGAGEASKKVLGAISSFLPHQGEVLN